MTRPPARPLAAIEKDLRSCRVIRVGAELELVHVRRRQAELADIEAVLVTTIERRREQADRLLDERLTAAAGGEQTPSRPPADDLCVRGAREPAPARRS
jgi:hypothetical protein